MKDFDSAFGIVKQYAPIAICAGKTVPGALTLTLWLLRRDYVVLYGRPKDFSTCQAGNVFKQVYIHTKLMPSSIEHMGLSSMGNRDHDATYIT